jgi:hypothetical protein
MWALEEDFPPSLLAIEELVLLVPVGENSYSAKEVSARM